MELQRMFGNKTFNIHNQKTCSYRNTEKKKTFQYVYRIIGKDETVDDVIINIVYDVKFLIDRKPYLTTL